MTGYFVTATGTDIGKTFCTAGLLRANPRLAAIKPLLSGYTQGAPSDSAELLAAMGREVSAQNIAAITPWRYAAPLSPDMAAAREGRQVEYEDILTFCRAAMAAASAGLLIEGAGGAAVPLTGSKLTIDWISDLAVPALLVTGSYLGSISHCITTADFLRHRGVPIRAILLNESEISPVPVAETRDALARYLPEEIFIIPRHAGPADFLPLAAAL